MTKIRIKKCEVNGAICAPPSKSYTHRALFLSSFSKGKSTIFNPLKSRDTFATVKTLRMLGVRIEESNEKFIVEGIDEFSVPDDVINVENSGTTLRIATALSSTIPNGYCVLTGDESIRKRPMQPLIEALNQLGVECFSTRNNGFPPIVVKGGGIKGGRTKLRADISSQFLTALLISSLKAKDEVTVEVLGKIVSKPYVEATIKMINIFGGKVETYGNFYRIYPRQRTLAANFKVPGDFSSISFFLVAGALLGKVEVRNLDFILPQADSKIIEILKDLGVNLKVYENKIIVEKSEIKEGKIDLYDNPDLLPPLSILGLASKRIELRNVRHARYKESDRIHSIAVELRKLGARVKEFEDGLVISKGKLRPAVLDAKNDHRLFMAFTVATMLTGGEVEGLESVSVSYPNFLDDLRKLGVEVELYRCLGT